MSVTSTEAIQRRCLQCGEAQSKLYKIHDYKPIAEAARRKFPNLSANDVLCARCFLKIKLKWEKKLRALQSVESINSTISSGNFTTSSLLSSSIESALSSQTVVRNRASSADRRDQLAIRKRRLQDIQDESVSSTPGKRIRSHLDTDSSFDSIDAMVNKVPGQQTKSSSVNRTELLGVENVVELPPLQAGPGGNSSEEHSGTDPMNLLKLDSAEVFRPPLPPQPGPSGLNKGEKNKRHVSFVQHVAQAAADSSESDMSSSNIPLALIRVSKDVDYSRYMPRSEDVMDDIPDIQSNEPRSSLVHVQPYVHKRKKKVEPHPNKDVQDVMDRYRAGTFGG